jgi:hypothetical protein
LGTPGHPALVIVVGDQPTYKILAEYWLSSRIASQNSSPSQGGVSPLHKWLVPFPGFFRWEKQANYAVAKGFLDGMGLQEMAACCGLSAANVRNILSHSHARNNRGMLCNIACAMVLRVIDVCLAESPTLQDDLQDQSPDVEVPQLPDDFRHVFSSLVTARVVWRGRRLRDAANSLASSSANGQHLVGTFLQACHLPALGFKSVGRSGHTDLLDSFLFRTIPLLHTSGHLKFQQLYIYYAFIRAVMPQLAVNDLYADKPGLSVLRVPSFTSGVSSGLSAR